MFGFKKKLSDDELVVACASNDRLAQEQLYRRFFPIMYRMCMRHTRDAEKAMDIVNTGMLRVFTKIHTFENRGSLEGWVRRLVYNCMSDHFRSNARYSHFLVFEEHDSSVPEWGNAQFYEEDILREVRKLPNTSQAVFCLYAIEGYSHGEISEKLNISEGTSKWHLSTARQKLKERLQSIENEQIKRRESVV